MSIFRSTIKSQPASWNIHPTQQLFAMGSCFVQNIGQRLQARKFKVQLNPFGIVYNPLVVAQGLQRLLTAQAYEAEELVFHSGRWCSLDHHGDFSHPDQAKCLTAINSRFTQAHTDLLHTDVLIITLGTAFVFEHLAQEKIVANCHKLPGTDFRRYRLTVAQVVDSLAPVLEQLKMQCILTVSPVRHLRDGLHDNQLSKATLLLAAEQLSQQFETIHYFPAYELVLDDLRDYRFYEEDLSHPSKVAVDYIWSHFSTTFFNEATRQRNQQVEQIIRASQHRPFHVSSKQHQQFVAKQLEKIAALEMQYPGIDFAAEREVFAAMQE